jgi:hypothetical protein
MLLASVLMGILVWFGSRTLELERFRGLWITCLRLLPIAGGGAAIYFLLIRILRLPEGEALTATLRRKLRF